MGPGDEIKIEIEELPEPIPKDFTGAVGQFNIEAKIDSDTLKVNEGFIYKITLKGTGNIGLFSLPKIKFPSSLDLIFFNQKFVGLKYLLI